MHNVQEILTIPGIVVRNIPPETVSLLTYRDGDDSRLRENEEVVVMHGRKFIQRTTKNEFHGYVITKAMGQESTVKFSKNTDGFGPTVESAYADFVEKNNMS